jgi:hypothetical protein
MAGAADLKSSVHPLTSFYQMILRSIYRRFSRQNKLRSCLVSQGESLIFPSYSSSDNTRQLIVGDGEDEDIFQLSVTFGVRRPGRSGSLVMVTVLGVGE